MAPCWYIPRIGGARADTGHTLRDMTSLHNNMVTLFTRRSGNNAAVQLDVEKLLTMDPETRERYTEWRHLYLRYTYYDGTECKQCVAKALWEEERWRIEDVDEENRPGFYVNIYKT